VLRMKPVQVLLAIPFLLLLPVFMLIGIVHDSGERRKRRRLASMLACPTCGARLSRRSAAIADSQWSEIMSKRPHSVRMRTIRCLDAICEACGAEIVFEEEPNKSPEPTPPSVTPRACARVAPAGGVAHL
jgi:hypothetical protein